MYVIRCFKCNEVLGGVINPASIPYLRCMHCGHDNVTLLQFAKGAEYYVDSREASVKQEADEQEVELRKCLFEQKVLV